MKKIWLILYIALAACSTKKSAQEIIDLAIETHGGNRLERAIVSFNFREREYSVERYGSEFTYSREFKDGKYQVKDIFITVMSLLDLLMIQ